MACVNNFMMKHVLLYVAVLAFIFLIILFGSYYLLPHWFPSLLGSRSNLDRDSQLAILKLLSGAVASFVTAVLAGATSVFSALYQIRASRDLETRKGEVLGEIEEVRASAAERLEVSAEIFWITSGHRKLIPPRNLKEYGGNQLRNLRE